MTAGHLMGRMRPEAFPGGGSRGLPGPTTINNPAGIFLIPL
jgi:hypothetical protein